MESRPGACCQRLAARGESPAAFERRCIPPGCVAPPSNIPDILGRHALPGGRLAALGATPDFHHGLLGSQKNEAASPECEWTNSVDVLHITRVVCRRDVIRSFRDEATADLFRQRNRRAARRMPHELWRVIQR